MGGKASIDAAIKGRGYGRTPEGLLTLSNLVASPTHPSMNRHWISPSVKRIYKLPNQEQEGSRELISE